MPTNQVFHTHTALADGLKALFKQLEERLSLRSPIDAYLAGGMAVHLYTASRVTTDVDAEFGSRVFDFRPILAVDRNRSLTTGQRLLYSLSFSTFNQRRLSELKTPIHFDPYSTSSYLSSWRALVGC